MVEGNFSFVYKGKATCKDIKIYIKKGQNVLKLYVMKEGPSEVLYSNSMWLDGPP
jgi:hypothetical protein